MYRRRPSTTLAEVETKKMKKEAEKKGVNYAVFWTVGNHAIEIFKLDSAVEGTEGKDDVQELGEPIFSLKMSEYPIQMFAFSVGSKIYFSGGFRIDTSIKYDMPKYAVETYMLDITSGQGITIVPNGSMNFGKKYPQVFGPVEGHNFYVFDSSTPTFEMFNTITNVWETILLPSFVKRFKIDGAASLCGSNILFSHYRDGAPTGGLSVFCTRTGNWRVIPGVNPISGKPYEIPILEGPSKFGNWPVFSEDNPEPYELPFFEACPVFRESKDINVNIFLAMGGHYSLPEVYTSLKLPPVGNHDQVAPIQHEGKLDGLEAQLKNLSACSWTVENCYSVSDTSICVVRYYYQSGILREGRALVEICDLSYSLEGTKVKIKVQNTSKYTYFHKGGRMTPIHFLVA